MKFLILLLPFSLNSLQAQIQLPANMYADSLYAPFLHGVASGEPLQDRVMIWTKVDPQGQTNPIALSWEMSTDHAFSNVIASGNVSASATKDWTVIADVTGLSPGSIYWYRFSEPGGNVTRIGRTKTAKAASPSQVRLAVLSCSSIYSGFFNAYRRIGERTDIDLVVHLGDYIYDFVDQDEQVRVPVPAPVDPSDLSGWRERHAYYLLDPDLRLARQMHPWVVIWDNHDIDHDTPQELAEAIQAFQEYIPMRLLDAGKPDQIWRKFTYGDLLELYLIDVNLNNDIDLVNGGEYSMMGDTQWTWLSGELQNSQSQWRVIGNEKMMAQFSLAGFPSFIPFGDGPVADSGSWDGYNAERTRLLSLLDSNNLDNNLIMSGDVHMSFACDLPIDYGTYDPGTGAGSVAVEFLPSSITRGNFDEAGFGGFLADLATTAMGLANPHHVYEELESHGYGIVDIRPSGTTAEFWYSDILSVTNSESFATGFICQNGDNHWERNAVGNPTVALESAIDHEEKAIFVSNVFPNPVQQEGRIEILVPKTQILTVSVIELASGKETSYAFSKVFNKGVRYLLDIPVESFSPGAYGLVIKGERSVELRRFVKF